MYAFTDTRTPEGIGFSAVLVFAPVFMACHLSHVIPLLFLSEYLLCKAPWVAVLFQDVSIST